MSKKSTDPVLAPRAPVISLPINVARLKSLGEMVKGSADAEALNELRTRLGILAVNAFSIEAKVSPWKKRGVQIEGHVRGEVEQSCVVTLAPVVEQIDEPFRITLVPKGSEFAKRAIENATMSEMVIDPEGEDPPEEFEGEEIDVGEYAEEFFALSLDDYPRAPGVEFSGHIEDKAAFDGSENPFAALAVLKEPKPKDE
ncbi:YceD family protein [Cohaesibacter marisflavi]|nr:DUF177 domain-containing protein [Cohaesibacter marisflavi]